jgi:putative transposase
MHAIWKLPPGDSDFSTRWRLIKTRFAKALLKRERLSAVRAARNERGIWQRRFWEHLIRDAVRLEWRITPSANPPYTLLQ